MTAKKTPAKKPPAKQPAAKAPAQAKPVQPAETPVADAPAKAKDGKHRVTVRSSDKRDFFRCGMRFTTDGVTVELTDDQLARIKAEPRLVIE